MKVYYFSECPYHEYPDEQGVKFPSLRLTFPDSYFNPNTAKSQNVRPVSRLSSQTSFG